MMENAVGNEVRELNGRFLDIRPEYGANSTILIEYLRGAHIEPSMKLATALLYGIGIKIIRSDGYRKDAGEFATRAFGDLGSAGGRRGAARAEIQLTALQHSGLSLTDKNLECFVKRRINL